MDLGGQSGAYNNKLLTETRRGTKGVEVTVGGCGVIRFMSGDSKPRPLGGTDREDKWKRRNPPK